jgi:hypothetical protein
LSVCFQRVEKTLRQPAAPQHVSLGNTHGSLRCRSLRCRSLKNLRVMCTMCP